MNAKRPLRTVAKLDTGFQLEGILPLILISRIGNPTCDLRCHVVQKVLYKLIHDLEFLSAAPAPADDYTVAALGDAQEPPLAPIDPSLPSGFLQRTQYSDIPHASSILFRRRIGE